jgi:hypothetical protein
VSGRTILLLLASAVSGVLSAAPQTILAAQTTPADVPAAGAQLAAQIHAAGLDPEACYRVRDLSIAREDIRLYFNDGYLIFSKPVRGERLSAVFSADVEGGDGEVLLLPPYRGERQSLARFTGSPNLDEHFRAALLVFTDSTGQTLLDRISRESLGHKAPEMGPVLADRWSYTLSNVTAGFTLRLVQDLLSSPANRHGFLFATVAGKNLGDFDLMYDPRAQQQIFAAQLHEHQGRPIYDIWSSFEARSFRTGASRRPAPGFATKRFRINAALDTSLGLTASTAITMTTGASPVHVLPFTISRAIHISSVRIDGAPAEVLFPDSSRGEAIRAGDNAEFLVVAPQVLAPSSTHQIEFEENGMVITPAGNGVYFVGARANWYPQSGPSMAVYDLTFRYPKNLTLVSPGEVTENRVEGDWRITHRVTSAPIRLAGFNLGDYEKIDASAPGFHVEVYGNRTLETALQPKPHIPPPLVETEEIPRVRVPGRGRFGVPPPVLLPPLAPPAPPPAPPDPLARLRAVAADVSSSLQFFAGLFGPPALPSLTVAPIPGTFGQGFPGLVYLSTLAYLNPNQRPPEMRGPHTQVFFSDLMEAHEVAHQWWGDLVVPAGYQDEWLPEALADYSSLLYLEKKKGAKAVEDTLADYRDNLLRKDASGHTVESAGPITWGYRLESATNEETWRAITYDKGAWILHMLRLRLGDQRFLAMLAELRRRFASRSLSTAEFRDLIKEFLPPHVTGSMIDEFFDNWVYATGIPTLKLHYSVKGLRLSGQIEQSGVDDDFSAQVPVEVQFARGAPETIWVETATGTATFSARLKRAPLHVSILEAGVLAARK